MIVRLSDKQRGVPIGSAQQRSSRENEPTAPRPSWTDEIPCAFVVAEYSDGERELPRLRAASDAQHATRVALEVAREKHRPLVRVFALDRGRPRLVLALRI